MFAGSLVECLQDLFSSTSPRSDPSCGNDPQVCGEVLVSARTDFRSVILCLNSAHLQSAFPVF